MQLELLVIDQEGTKHHFHHFVVVMKLLKKLSQEGIILMKQKPQNLVLNQGGKITQQMSLILKLIGMESLFK